MFNLQTACLVFWSRTIPAYITGLQPGIGSSHTTASASARGHSGAQSEPQSAQWWEFTLSVRCQVELFHGLKEKSIVCESPVHCHTTFFCPEQIQDKRAHKVISCSASKVEMYFSSTGRLQHRWNNSVWIRLVAKTRQPKKRNAPPTAAFHLKALRHDEAKQCPS